MKKHRLQKVLKIILVVIAACVVFGFVVEGLWNSLMPHIFGWHAITYWQALGIFLLSKILFGGPRPGGRMGWRRGMRERWAAMTPEQREAFRQAIGHRCGSAHAEAES